MGELHTKGDPNHDDGDENDQMSAPRPTADAHKANGDDAGNASRDHPPEAAGTVRDAQEPNLGLAISTGPEEKLQLPPLLPTPAMTPADPTSRSPTTTADSQYDPSDHEAARHDASLFASTSASESELNDPAAATAATTTDSDAHKKRTQQGASKDLRVDTQASRPRNQSFTRQAGTQDKVRRLSASKMQELASSPESLPLAPIPDRPFDFPLSAGLVAESASRSAAAEPPTSIPNGTDPTLLRHDRNGIRGTADLSAGSISVSGSISASATPRPTGSPRTVSTPPINRRRSGTTQAAGTTNPRRNSFHPAPRAPGHGPVPAPLNLDAVGAALLPRAVNANAELPLPSDPATSTDGQPPQQQNQGIKPTVASPPVDSRLPLPPMSVPTFLQLELAGQRPSPLYIQHSYAGEVPYESSAVKLARLKNFLLLPSFLERTILFGALACLDAWLWTFTILPMRFAIAIGVLVKWWASVVGKEAHWAINYVRTGFRRWWRRGRRGRATSRGQGDGSAGEESRSPSRVRDVSVGSSVSTGVAVDGQPVPRTGLASRTDTSAGNIDPAAAAAATATVNGAAPQPRRPHSRSHSHSHSQPPAQLGNSRHLGHGLANHQSHSHRRGTFRHRRSKSIPSELTSFHKADMLQGFVIIFSSLVLMKLDASRMYHFIRAQSAIKLYVIYNGLEVGDRLLSALGQDIFECLFSSEVLARDSLGRSKVLLPFGMFLLALAYNVLHAVTLFYQVITLNVAVNSYSNALLTLLISNQFVEIKSAVFKRFEKENTFQLTCADVVERFQLWIMLLIIGMRNIVEVGGLTIPGAGTGGAVGGGGLGGGPGGGGSGGLGGDSGSNIKIPLHSPSILPASFTALPAWLWSGEVLSPFLIVTGSETIVDWIKHAYINKFNNIKPNFYGRVLDILCKDYYTNAFVTPGLTRRLGLPLIPLSCLFIRASFQTYHMFLATHLPAPLPPSTQTALTVDSTSATPSSQAMAAALDRFDTLIRNALGRAVHGLPYGYAGTLNGTDSILGGSGSPLPPRGTLFLGRRYTSDDAVAALTMITVFFLAFLVLLVVKLLLGMALLRYSRGRYARMRARELAVAAGQAEPEVFEQKGTKRLGGYGSVEVGEERRAWLYADDKEGLAKAQNLEKRRRERGEKDLGRITRYEMVAKRIW